jgi:tetratricopeptide (TPR) repeat protein
MEWSTGVPIFVVGTARPELFEKHLQWAGGSRNATTISLSALTDAEIGQLISVLLSKAVLPAEIHAALLERAGGNPLYAEEFIRMLSDRGVLQARGRSLALDPDADIPMPENVHALIAARLDTLSPERKALLQDAAVVGKVFWSGALAARSGSDDTTVRRSLQELVRKELVRPTRTSSIEAEHEYSFWHALIRDVAYGSIPRSRRAAGHASVLRWIESVTHGRDEEFAELLAHHAELAGDVDRMARYAMLAGHRNRRVFAAEEAIRWYERALSAAQGLPPNITKVLVPEIAHSRGEALEQLGRFEEAQADYEEALAIARSSGRAWLEATLLAALTHILALQDRLLDARALLPNALRAARAAGMEDLEARLLSTAGSLAWGQGDLARALSSHEHALQIAEEARDVEGEAYARHGLAETLCLLGPLEDALAQGRRAQELWRSLGQRPMEHHSGHVLGCLYVLLGRPGEAQLAIDNAARGQQELGQRRYEPLALAARVMTELSRGDLGAAFSSATAGVENGKDVGGPRTELVALLLRMLVLSELSAGSLGEQDLSAAQRLKVRVGGFFEPPLVSAQGWFELQRGRLSEATRTFAHARREAEAGLFYRLICGGLEVRAQEAAHHETHLRDAAKWLLDAAAGSSPAYEALALWALARADQMEGNNRAAQERANSALELAQSVCDLTVAWRACSVVAAASWSLGDATAAAHARDTGLESLSSIASSIGDEELRNLFLGRPDIAGFRAAADS